MVPETAAIGLTALAKVDKVLSEKPHKVGHDFSEATRCLTQFRDALIVDYRQTGSEPDRERLEKVNAVLAVVVGGHFPLGEIPWPHIEKARALLAQTVDA